LCFLVCVGIVWYGARVWILDLACMYVL